MTKPKAAAPTGPLTLLANAVTARIDGADRETMLMISELLSYSVEGAQHMGVKGWDGKSSFFSMRERTFPAGFFHAVHQELLNKGLHPRIARKLLPEPNGPESPIVDAFGNDDPRYDYQLQALRAVERHGRGIIQVATGGGKSKIAKLIAARYRRMTLFITTRGVLMYQMKEGFEAAPLNFRCGVVGDGVFAPVKGVNVGMVQTLVAGLKEPTLDGEHRKLVGQLLAAEERAVAKLKTQLKRQGLKPASILAEVDKLCARQVTERISDAEAAQKAKVAYEAAVATRARLIKLLEMVEVVIGEEAHEAGGDSYFEILRHCRNAQIRVALTATPYMRDDAEANLRLMAAFGGVLIKISEKLLIDRGILAKPYFRFAEAAPHKLLRKTTPWNRAYTYGYIENLHMRADIVAEAKTARSYGLPVLTLIQRVAHGEALMADMQAAGLRVAYLKGENDQAERKRELARLERGQIDVLIGSTIVDVGVDVPAIGLVQLAGGGKAEVALRQRVGRGLRAKKGMANACFISDWTTGPNETFREHTKTRRAIIEGTPGFVEGILPSGADFPWHLFDQVRAAA